MTAVHPSLSFSHSEHYHNVYQADLGKLFQGDCRYLLRNLPAESVDLVFADPPFNLGKDYGKDISDLLKREEYLTWSKDWL